jgi:hypothetical protein
MDWQQQQQAQQQAAAWQAYHAQQAAAPPPVMLPQPSGGSVHARGAKKTAQAWQQYNLHTETIPVLKPLPPAGKAFFVLGKQIMAQTREATRPLSSLPSPQR